MNYAMVEKQNGELLKVTKAVSAGIVMTKGKCSAVVTLECGTEVEIRGAVAVKMDECTTPELGYLGSVRVTA